MDTAKGTDIEEEWEAEQRIIVVKISIPAMDDDSSDLRHVETGLSSDMCLQVRVRGCPCIQVDLPCRVQDEGPIASAKLLKKSRMLVVRLPECKPKFDASHAKIAGKLDFGMLFHATGQSVRVVDRCIEERRLRETASVKRNLFWVRGLVSLSEVAEVLAVARSSSCVWDTSTADSVDNLPVFEKYLVFDGAAQTSLLAHTLPSIVDRLCAYVRSRYECPSATLCHALLRRYLPEERRIHPPHYDAHAFVTLVVGLNPHEYEGGLYVQSSPKLATRQYLQVEGGDVLSHTYDLLHGVRTFSGVRYSLIFWFKDSHEACVANTSPWYLSAAKDGDDVAQFNLGMNFKFGRWGCSSDAKQAECWYERSAAQNNFMALTQLARLRENDNRISEAKALYKRAAALGSSKGMMNLARLAMRGSSATSINEKEAVIWLTQAAEEEEPEALCVLGKIYAQGGFGVACDSQKALDLFRRSAALGYPEARELAHGDWQ